MPKGNARAKSATPPLSVSIIEAVRFVKLILNTQKCPLLVFGRFSTTPPNITFDNERYCEVNAIRRRWALIRLYVLLHG